MTALSHATHRPGRTSARSVLLAGSWLIVCLLVASTGTADEALPRRSSVDSSASPASEGLIASPEPGWPQWRGPRRDGISDEQGLLRQWPEGGPKLLWSVDDLGRGWSSPIVVDGRVYITGDVEDDLVVYALDLEGKPLWKAKNGRAWPNPFPGARACCVYSEGRIYNMNAYGRVVCLEAATGRELWAVDILQRFDGKNITWALSECLLVDGPRLIVTPGGRKALVAALDKRDGRTLWTTPPLKNDRATHSSPILFRHAGRRIVANCSSAHGFGVDADTGRLLWTVPLRNRYGTNVATPIYGDGRIFYVTPYGELGRLYRLVPAGQGIDAQQVWTHPLDTVTGCGVVVDGTLYAAGYRRPKHWFAVDWASGETRTELEDLTTGAAIYADGRLYVQDERGTVALVDPSPDALQITGRFALIAKRVRDAWAHPVLLDGRLYVRYHDTLRCYDVKARR